MNSFTVKNADNMNWPLVVSLPHSGTAIPAEMQKALVKDVLMPNTDWFLPDLYAFLPWQGVTTIENHMSRYVADPNREVKEAADGNYLGSVVYQQSTWRRTLYAKPLTQEQIKARLDQYYWPYHQALAELLAQKVARFGHCLLIDLHSFAEYTHTDGRKPCQVVLGNQNDRTSSKQLRETFAQALKAQNFSVENNFPFAGGYITRHFGAEAQVSALQIELRYNAYIDQRFFGEEELQTPSPEVFQAAQARMQAVWQRLLAGMA